MRFFKSGDKTPEKHKKLTESGGETSKFGQNLKIPPNFDTKFRRGCILLGFRGSRVQNANFLTRGGANVLFEPFLQLIFVRVKGRFVLFQHFRFA